ncbi:hypothetical protein HRbin31_00804 [bacterium HR31]|nr:hypothetical protein HRbin31_00804 [bacterium HR31]
MVRPWCMTTTRCAVENTTSMSCSQNRTDSPCSRFRRAMSCRVEAVSSGDIPAVGSSRTSSRGRLARARAISRMRWSPWDRVPAIRCAWPLRPVTSRISHVWSTTNRLAGRNSSKPLRAWARHAACTLSNTVNRGNTLAIWKVRPTPARHRRWAGQRVTSTPPNTTRPRSGSRTPVTRLNRVVLPAPLGPMTATTSPASTDRKAPRTAGKPLKERCRSSTRSSSATDVPRGRRPGGGGAVNVPPLLQVAHDPLREEEDEEDQQHAQHEGPVLRVAARQGP